MGIVVKAHPSSLNSRPATGMESLTQQAGRLVMCLESKSSSWENAVAMAMLLGDKVF